MNSPVLALTVLILFCGLSAAAQPLSPAEPTAIRDIRGPLSPPGLPPFAGSVLVLLGAGLGLAVAVKARKRRTDVAVSSPTQSDAIVDLDALRDAYARAELPAALLFQHLAGIARSQLVLGDSGAMTSAEVLKIADEIVPAEMITIAADLFAVCDRVRFGGCPPDTADVAEACAAVRQLLHHQPGTAS